MEQIAGRFDQSGESEAAGRADQAAGGRARNRPARANAENASPLLTQPQEPSGSLALLDAHAFRNAVCAYLAIGRASFTLVVLRPVDAALIGGLGETLLRVMRVRSGDLAGCLEGALAVYLHAATPVEAARFVDRVNSTWRLTGGAPVVIGVATYPAQEHRIIDLLSADWRDDEALVLLDPAAGSATS